MFGAIFLPQFPLQAALRHERELWAKPVALVDPNQRTPTICELTETAHAAGVTTGITATQALARCRDIIIRPCAAKQENAATNALLQCAYAFSPNLEATKPGLCTLDLRGLTALSEVSRLPKANEQDFDRHRGLFVSWAEKLQKSLAQVQLSARIGLAQTPNLAAHAARWGCYDPTEVTSTCRLPITIIEEAKTFMAALPVAALEPSPESALLLSRWGIRTVGELLKLRQDLLGARLGLEALALLAAASTSATRPLHLARPSERFEECCNFDNPIETLEPLLFPLRRFVDQLSQRLEWRGLVAETLVLHLSLDGGAKVVCRLRIPQSTRQPDVLFRALQTLLETFRTESPIKGLTLTVLPGRAEQKQLSLFETVLSDPQRFQETLARLAAVLGSDRVGTPALDNTHRPDAFRLVPPDFENAPVPEIMRESPAHSLPLRRFRPALKAEVEGTSAPVSIRCAVAKGRLRIVIGPWQASGNWWEPGAWERKEWDAQTSDGQVLRLVRQHGGWFVEGVID